jgi:hypothetical protein
VLDRGLIILIPRKVLIRNRTHDNSPQMTFKLLNLEA